MMEKVGVAILAAGMARRMGQQKLLLPLHGKPLLAHVLETASAFPWGDRVAVIGDPREALTRVCREYNFPVCYNLHYAEGQASSVRLAAEQLSQGMEAMLFLLGDQPLVSPALIQEIVMTYERQNDPQAIVVPCHKGQNYSPVLFGAYWRPQLSSLSGDSGGRAILRENPGSVVSVEWPYRDPFCDVDTWEEYRSLCKEWETSENAQ
jgi:molybdenum cofactor cytidylyltransferase